MLTNSFARLLYYKYILEYICNIVSGQKNLSTSSGEIPGKLGLTNSTIPLISYSDIKKTRYSNDSDYAYYSLQFIIPSAYINKGDTCRLY